jgi:hypothetical protein
MNRYCILQILVFLIQKKKRKCVSYNIKNKITQRATFVHKLNIGGEIAFADGLIGLYECHVIFISHAPDALLTSGYWRHR